MSNSFFADISGTFQLRSMRQVQIDNNVLGRDEGYTVKYTHLPEGVPKGKARGNS